MTDLIHPRRAPLGICCTPDSLSLVLHYAAPQGSIYRNFVTPPEDPRSGHLFVFTNTQRTRLKILFWDGSGLWVCAKRLEKGRFRWPSPGRSEDDATKVRLSAAALAMLLGGLDPVGVRLRRWMRLNE